MLGSPKAVPADACVIEPKAELATLLAMTV
jgi:hypothetical protein